MQTTFPHELPRILGKYEFMVYYLLACAEQEKIAPVSRQWLVQNMPQQTSPSSVTYALNYLCAPERQIAIKLQKGFRLLTGGMQLPLEKCVLVESPVETSGPVVVVDSSSNTNPSTITTLTTTTTDDMSPAKTHTVQILRDNGVYGNVARGVAALEWATPEYVTAMIEYAKRGNKFDNPVGMAVYWIKENAPLPGEEPPVDSDDNWKYTRGKYAAFVNRDEEPEEEQAEEPEAEEPEADEQVQEEPEA